LRNVPLIVLLHGAHGSHWNWAITGGAHRTAQRLIGQGLIPPLVLAMPSDGLWGDGTGYLTHAAQDFEKWIVQDVPLAARAAAACLSPDSPLFLCGLSMGGFGALRIGAKYPVGCRGISAHSSITHFEQMKLYVEEDASLFGAPAEDYSVLATMLRHRATLPPIRFDCGSADALLEHNRQLHRDLDAHGIAHRYEEFPGGHDWNYWAAHVEDSLRFFGEILAGQNRL
jgi:S-formylglutathione hydrolase FrmB